VVRITLPSFLTGDLVEIVYGRGTHNTGDVGIVTAVGNPELSPVGEQKYALLINGVKTIIYAYEIKLHTMCKSHQSVV
jgi:hypothetical protein